jgi:hypothetical protein
LIREVSESQKRQLSLAEQSRSNEDINERKLFGDIDKWINHNRHELSGMTLAGAALREWDAIESLLRLALTGRTTKD